MGRRGGEGKEEGRGRKGPKGGERRKGEKDGEEMGKGREMEGVT